MLSTVPDSESTPYLYYLVAWVWANVAGDGEAALRSLSALFGVATVAAVWAAARELVSERAALVAGVLAALNPFLVWYSQEARAYALLALLCAVSFWLFARALARPGDARALAWWALASALAIATHYFAAFTVVPEAIALAVLIGRTRAWTLACGFVGLVAVAHVPLVAQQRRGGGADWIGDLSLEHRVAEIPKRFAAGEFGNQLNYLFWPALACTALALVILWRRSEEPERRGGAIALAVGGAGLLIPIAFALVTLDYVFPRNLIGSLPVLLVALGAALTSPRARRAGVALSAALAVLFAVALVRTATDGALQRDDWRGVRADLGDGDRLIVVAPDTSARSLLFYTPRTLPLWDTALPVDDIAVVELTRATRDERRRPAPPPGGFRAVRTVDADSYRVVVFRARERVPTAEGAAATAVAPRPAEVIVDPPN